MNDRSPYFRDAFSVLEENERVIHDALSSAVEKFLAHDSLSAFEQLGISNINNAVCRRDARLHFGNYPDEMKIFGLRTIGPIKSVPIEEPSQSAQNEVDPRPLPSPRRRPVADPLSDVLKNLGLADSPGSHSFKEIVRQAAQRMPKPPTSDAANHALEKAVSRHYRRRETK